VIRRSTILLALLGGLGLLHVQCVTGTPDDPQAQDAGKIKDGPGGKKDGPGGKKDGPGGKKDGPGKEDSMARDLRGPVPGGWVQIKAGKFMMGAAPGELCASKTREMHHQVSFTHKFEITRHEVTQGQFKGVMGYNPAKFTACGLSCPVERVSWHEAAAYCNKLSGRKGVTPCYDCTGSGTSVTCTVHWKWMQAGSSIYKCPGYRLPTDAEWEYAYRAGTTTAYYSGTNDKECYGCNTPQTNAASIAWYCANAKTTTHPVGKKMPNKWGLFDMAGNVWEWVGDWYTADLGTTPVKDPWNNTQATYRTVRGGSWDKFAAYVRAAHRYYRTAYTRSSTVGFRPARTRF